MKQNEWPPEQNSEEVETLEFKPFSEEEKRGRAIEQKKIDEKESALEIIPNTKTTPSEKEITAIKKDIESAFEKGDITKLKDIAEQKKRVTYTPRGIQTKPGFLGKAKTWLLGLTALGLSTAASGQTKQAEKDPQTKGKIEVYTKANTKEGGITPTGLSNSFLENKYGVTTDDIYTVAKHYGFSTENKAAFQKDMFDYVKEKKPEVLDALFEEFGTTNYGESRNMSATDFMQYYDEILGARGAKVISILKEEMNQPKKTLEQYSEFSQRGESIFGPDGKIVGELCYPTRKTDTVTSAGNLNTSEIEAVIRWRDDFGFIGAVQEIKKDRIQKLFGTTNHFQDPTSPELLAGLKLIKEKREGTDLLTKNK